MREGRGGREGGRMKGSMRVWGLRGEPICRRKPNYFLAPMLKPLCRCGDGDSGDKERVRNHRAPTLISERKLLV
ncbi:hypothetical protein M0804_006361 [Polistes exclamans]|nr:hypothetical protein M0804_006361 [Polistes exclamans]